MFEFKTKIRFHQTDAAGILFYGNVFYLVHDAYEELLAEFSPGRDYFTDPEFVIPIVHCESDFNEVMLTGEEVTIKVFTAAIKNSSFKLEYEIYGAKDNLKAVVRTVHVFIRKDNLAKTEIPEMLREKLMLLVRKTS